MLTGLLGLLGGATALGGKAFDWLNTRTDARRYVAGPIAQGATQNATDEYSWFETRLMIAATIAIFVFHVGAVVFDSVFHTGHVTYALPHPMDTWEGDVLLAPFALSGALAVVTRIFGK